MEGFLRYRFGGSYIWRGLYMEGLIFRMLRYLSSQVFKMHVYPKHTCCLAAKSPLFNFCLELLDFFP